MFLFAKLPFDRAIAITVIGGFLFLPSNMGLTLPAMPLVDKAFVISVAVGLGWLCFRPERPEASPRAKIPGRNLTKGLTFITLALLFLTPFLTYATNLEAIIVADSFRPPLTITDPIRALQNSLMILPPLLIARAYLVTEDSRRVILQVIVIMALIYTPLVLFELRMSPQLNRLVYGYFPHSWIQHMRAGGFRPVVFLTHGLWLGFFLLTATLSAFILVRTASTGRERMQWLLSGLWLFLVLAVSRNLGALVIAIVFVPLIFFTWRRLWMRVAMVVAIFFLVFPAVRQTGILPLQDAVARVEAVYPDRAGSLAFRFDNEDRLLARALEKPVAGWGGWGRGRVFNERGEDISVTDGMWIIVLGHWGWLGYIGFFGLITAPLLLLPGVRRRADVSTTLAGMTLLVAVALIYSIPNAGIMQFNWIFIGAMMGAVLVGTTGEQSAAPPVETRGGERKIRYTRYGADRSPTSNYSRAPTKAER